MKSKLLSSGWEQLIGENLPTIEFQQGDPDWLLSVLGWKKDGRRRG